MKTKEDKKFNKWLKKYHKKLGLSLGYCTIGDDEDGK